MLLVSFANTWWSVVPGDRQVLFHGQPLLDLLQIATFIGLLFTLYFSLRAIRESARANTLSSLPILTLKYLPSGARSQNAQMQIENIGNGAAINIRVDSFYQSFVNDIFSPKKADHYVLRVGVVDILAPKAQEALDTSNSIVGGLIDAEMMIFKIFNNAKPLAFYLRFQDIAGTNYISKVTIKSEGTQEVGRPKRYTLLRHLRYYIYRGIEFLHLMINRHNANRWQKENNNKQP